MSNLHEKLELTPGVSSKGQLNVVGLGVNPWDHASLKALRCIRAAKVLFCVPMHEQFVNFHKDPSARVCTLVAHLGVPSSRAAFYTKSSRAIIEAYLREEHVTWVTDGDPTLNCGISAELTKSSIADRVCIVSGIPSFIAVNALLNANERTDSVLQVSARHLFADEIKIDDRFCLHIIQVFQHMSPRLLPYLHARRGSLLDLKNILLRFYFERHLCHLIAAETAYAGPRIITLALDQLQDFAEEVTPQTTLVVPPARSGLERSANLAALWAREDSEKYLSPLESLAKGDSTYGRDYEC